jgi:hypothetical protein
MADCPPGTYRPEQEVLTTEGARLARQVENDHITTDVNAKLFEEKLNLCNEDYQTILKALVATNHSDVITSHYQLPTISVKEMGPIPVKDELIVRVSNRPPDNF